MTKVTWAIFFFEIFQKFKMAAIFHEKISCVCVCISFTRELLNRFWCGARYRDRMGDESDMGKKKFEKTQKLKMAAIYMNTAITRVALFRLKCKFLERDHNNNRKYLSNKKRSLFCQNTKCQRFLWKTEDARGKIKSFCRTQRSARVTTIKCGVSTGSLDRLTGFRAATHIWY